MDDDVGSAEGAIPLGRQLRAAREAAGWSQRELARRAGVHQPQVAKAERGDDLHLSLMLRLAAPLGLNLGLLPGGSPSAEKAAQAVSVSSDGALHDEVDDNMESWRRTYPDIDPAMFAIVTRLSLAGRHTDEATEVLAARHGLRGGDVMVLGALHRVGAPYESTPTELRRYFWISLPGLKKRLDRLESLGMIEREVNPRDRRGVVVRATASGLAVVDSRVTRARSPIWQALGEMSDAERARFAGQLRQLLLGVRRHAVASGFPSGLGETRPDGLNENPD